jgi:DNA-binding beta-propeller fold protein YncE
MRLVFCALALGLGFSGAAMAAETPARAFPKFVVDPFWPKQLPDDMIMGDLAGISVDASDHVWVLSRQKTLDQTAYLGLEKMQPTSECCRHAPAVMEFDPDGNLVAGWGGPYTPTDIKAEFEWPDHEHGLTVDYKGNMWICGNGKDAAKGIDDNQCLKMSRTGKFLLQVGHSGKSKGSLDTVNLNHPSQVAVWQKTNEAFIADGYVNRRVIVVDNDTGKFKRMWGAYGRAPDDKAPADRSFDGPPPQQFNLVHGITISNDGLVYVSDRQNNRIQVFTLEGKFIKEAFIHRDTRSVSGTSYSTAFSADKEQKFLYDADLANFKVRVFDRLTLQEIPGAAFGHAGPYAGQFNQLHIIATDSKGNLYTTEANGARVQKWIYKGMSE